ncbi:ThiF family adenylyltransferase [Nocardioides sp. 31GB23]|uniref:HesA/MoeB/ThiF family protein n=1 Tax=Nocardioides sp. 31GB23 TaxID=3156065 RepID=UPI0032AFF8D6
MTVRFPQTYPHFPAEVYDPDNTTGATRHRDPVTGLLCLAHQRDHHPERLLVDVMTQQLPKLLATERPGANHAALEDAAVGYGLNADQHPATVVVPDVPIPAHLDAGAVEVRYPHELLRQGRVAAGVVTHIWGENFDAPHTSASIRTDFPVVEVGRWMRDPDYQLGQSAGEVWQRIQDQLPPLEVTHERHEGRPEGREDTRAFETIGLLVPATETTYRTLGDSWVFLRRFTLTLEPGSDPTEVRWLANAAHLNTDAVRQRTPVAASLADRVVVVVGCGAIGHQIAIDLARTGVGTLVLIDGDTVDPTTASRQHAPLLGAGHPKASELALTITGSNPACDVRTWPLRVQSLWEHHSEDLRDTALVTRAAISGADLIIDATADPNVTSFLGAIRYNHGLPFLAVAGTAGIWGGWVASFNPARGTGCVECLAHHRSDPASPVPVPPADPAGWVNPPRCSEPTFTGTNPDVATIAHHASRVALHDLTGTTLGGDYYVASLRTSDGTPQPACWSRSSLPPHRECRCSGRDTVEVSEQLALALTW